MQATVSGMHIPKHMLSPLFLSSNEQSFSHLPFDIGNLLLIIYKSVDTDFVNEFNTLLSKHSSATNAYYFNYRGVVYPMHDSTVRVIHWDKVSDIPECLEEQANELYMRYRKICTEFTLVRNYVNNVVSFYQAGHPVDSLLPMALITESSVLHSRQQDDELPLFITSFAEKHRHIHDTIRLRLLERMVCG